MTRLVTTTMDSSRDEKKVTGNRMAIDEPTTETIELSIDSKLDFVDRVGAVTKEITSKLGFDEDDASWIELAVHEAVINGVTHGNKQQPDKKVDVKFVVESGSLTVFVRDYGSGFDPSSLPDPTDSDNLLNPTGRGIFYMRTFMDEVELATHPEGGSLVRMKKYKR